MNLKEFTIMTLKQFKKRAIKIAKRGFIKTNRRGDGAAGGCFEDELGLKENNESRPDIDNYEIKTVKRNVKGEITGKCTLFTWEGIKNMSDSEILENYGYDSGWHDGELAFSITAKQSPNSRGFYLNTTDDYLALCDVEDYEIIKWPWDGLAEKFEKKFPNLLQIIADTKIVKGKNYFHFSECTLYEGTSGEVFRKVLERDQGLVMETRLHTRYSEDRVPRNHGMSFRIPHNKFGLLFESSTSLY